MKNRFLQKFRGALLLVALSLWGSLGFAQTTVQIGTGTSTNSYSPIYSCYVYNYSQQVYWASELTAGGASGASFISKIRFYVGPTAQATSTWQAWQVFLGNTSVDGLATTTSWQTGLTQVFNGNIPAITANSWMELTLSTPFYWDGTSNLVVAVYENSPGYYCTQAWGSYTASAPVVSGGTRRRLFYSDPTDPTTSPTVAANNSNNVMAQIQFEMTSASACSGTVNAGTVTGPTSVCPNAPFTVSNTGYTSGTGMTFQWQDSTATSGVWADILTGTSPNYSATGITVATAYRLIATCTNSSSTDTSNVVTVGMNSFVNCYCTTSMANSTADEDIFNVSFGSLNNTSDCITAATGTGSQLSRYGNYTNLTPPTIYQDQPYPLSVSVGSCGSYNYTGWMKVWIDMNHDGQFTSTNPNEEVMSQAYGTSVPTTAYSQSVTISSVNFPDTGVTRMRIVAVESGSASSVLPCGSYGYGETEDYLIYVPGPAPPCSGANAGTITANKTKVCNAQSFTLSVSGASPSMLGTSYQWYRSDKGLNSWTPILGATSTSYTDTQLVSSDYFFEVGCSATMYDSSNIVSVDMDSFYNCYCSPLTGVTLHTCCGNYITNVAMTGTTLNNSSTVAGAGYYTQYSQSVPSQTATVTQGVPYSLNTTLAYSGYGADVWIDLNRNGLFESTEYFPYTGTSNGVNPLTQSVIIPTTSDTGLTGMRVRMFYPPAYGAGNACQNYGNGYETEDYVINILAAPTCSGTPSAGVAYGPSLVCATGSFTIADSAFSFGVGITYQWQDSSAVTGTWTDILNATNPSYTFTTGITVAASYRMIITCTNSFSMDTSNVHAVALDSFYKCYCSPLTGVTLHTCCGNYITNVNITGTTLNNTTITTGAGYYTQYLPNVSSQTGDIIQGLPYTYNTMLQYTGYGADIWIDINGNGIYESTEYYPFTGTLTSTSVPLTQSITVPTTSVTGLTGMRVRMFYPPAYGAGNACQNYGNGYETEDYVINILAAPTCSGTPVAGVAYGPSGVCPSQTFTVLDSAFSFGMGITYQWQDSSVNASWTDILTGTAPSYTNTAGITVPTAYRLVVTCTNSSAMDTSNSLLLGINSFLSCYCASVPMYPYDEEILNVTFGSLNNTSTCATTAPGPGSINQLYSNYTTSVAAPTVMQGALVPFSVQVGTCGGNYGNMTKVYIDFNQNGVFEPLLGEEAYASASSSTGPNTQSGSITIPITADTGLTMMRVINSEQTSATFITPCGNTNYYYGETEDYFINVSAAVPCTGTPTAGTTSGGGLLCPNTGFTITTSGTTTAGGMTYQWQSSPSGANSWTDIIGATNLSYAVPSGILTSTDYRMYVVCTNSSSSDTTTVSSVTLKAPTLCYCTPTNAGGAGSLINAVAFKNLYNNTSAVTPPSTNYSSFNMVAQVNKGDTGLLSITIDAPSTYSAAIVSVWIDYDQSGTYDASEWTQVSTSLTSGTTGSIVLTVPLTAQVGYTGMRIRTRGAGNQNGAGDACLNMGSGETEDYLVQIGYPLAIKLKDISAINQGSKNRVDWSTEAELKSDKFDLERSVDGRNYTKLATINAKGEASNYSYVDASPATGVNYYRLKLVDAAGTTVTSKVVTATVKNGAFTVEAYPNPVSHVLTVKVYGATNQNAVINVTDITGKVLKVVNVVNAEAKVDMSGLANGIYLVKYTDNQNSQTIRVNKQ